METEVRLNWERRGPYEVSAPLGKCIVNLYDFRNIKQGLCVQVSQTGWLPLAEDTELDAAKPPAERMLIDVLEGMLKQLKGT